jgi:hypothetical protein
MEPTKWQCEIIIGHKGNKEDDVNIEKMMMKRVFTLNLTKLNIILEHEIRFSKV